MFSDDICSITDLCIRSCSQFVSITDLHYYKFHILLSHASKYFLTFLFWVVSSDLFLLTYRAADIFVVTLPGYLVYSVQCYIHGVVNRKDEK